MTGKAFTVTLTVSLAADGQARFVHRDVHAGSPRDPDMGRNGDAVPVDRVGTARAIDVRDVPMEDDVVADRDREVGRTLNDRRNVGCRGEIGKCDVGRNDRFRNGSVAP